MSSFSRILFSFYFIVFSAACSQEVGTFLFDEDSAAEPSQPEEPTDPNQPEEPAEPTTKPVIVITGQDTNHRGVSAYEIDGTPIGLLTHFRVEGSIPRGIAPFDFDSFLVSVDGSDAIHRVFMDGTRSIFHVSAQFTGNIYGLAPGLNDRFYGIETNRIEVFDEAGINMAAAAINTTTGACVLSNPRGLFVNSAGQLIVTNSGGSGNILIYDVSVDAATCVSSVALGNSPYGVIEHSDGHLYVTTQADDRVYRTDADGSNPVAIWDTNLTLINNPTGLVEMPNGDLLVVSSVTDTVERITTSGTRVGSIPFIQDVFSLNVNEVQIIEVNE